MIIDKEQNGMALRFVLEDSSVRVYYKDYVVDEFKVGQDYTEAQFHSRVSDYTFQS